MDFDEMKINERKRKFMKLMISWDMMEDLMMLCGWVG